MAEASWWNALALLRSIPAYLLRADALSINGASWHGALGPLGVGSRAQVAAMSLWFLLSLQLAWADNSTRNLRGGCVPSYHVNCMHNPMLGWL